jgi:hypothetical protein
MVCLSANCYFYQIELMMNNGLFPFDSAKIMVCFPEAWEKSKEGKRVWTMKNYKIYTPYCVTSSMNDPDSLF